MRFPLTLLLFSLLCTCAPAPQNTEAAVAAAPPAYEDIGPAEFAERIGQPNTVLLDVRTPAETAGGIIEGALEIDYRAPDFAEQIKSLDPNKTYLVYCAVGGRSSKTCELLNEMGVKQAYNLKGGYSAWKQR